MTRGRMIRRRIAWWWALGLGASGVGPMGAQSPIPDSAFTAMRWRLVGPFRGGRALAIEGMPGDPATFYFGSVAGGVWRTRDAGTTWQSLTDDVPFASVGALALAPSAPNVIYVGTGEADMRSDITYGNGIWKSTDAGRHWAHLGLSDTRQIGRILVDPHDPNLVLVAALGHAYGPNGERGVYRSTDGGVSWQKVLFRNDQTGAIDLASDPTDPRTVYASLWQAQRTPWSQYPPNGGPGSGVFKSTDEGQTWTELSGHGLPGGELGRVGLAVGRNSGGRIVYALCSQANEAPGLYRSDDGGASWRLVGHDRRMGRGWYFGQVFLDPANADVVYVPNQSILQSVDGGRTFRVIKGSPGGDDYHYVWIDPTNSRHLAFASDQGVGVSLDGGATWSDWYNQPTGQFYHVATDWRWPYWIYGAQQDAGSIATASRSDFGEITFRDWFPPGAGESGYIVPDPRDSMIVYGGGTYGEVFRFDRVTNQTQDIAPWPRARFGQAMPDRTYRFTWTSPLVFDPIDKRSLYFGSQAVLRTTDGGLHWETVSPDLTRGGGGARSGTPGRRPGPTIETASAQGWGVIYTIAPSPVREGVIWAGTDNGRIQITTDGGGHWRDVTPSALTPWSKVSLIDASPFDAGTAYAAIDRHRLDDIGPHIYRTHDYGATWTRSDGGIPMGAYARAIRADPIRRGLLYAGTELGVFVSFDDGAHWQSLQLNLPVSPVHDLVVHDNDLLVATHGRSFWVLDDVSPLRTLTPDAVRAAAHLLPPSTAVRVRRSAGRDTPLPPEIPHGENPPAGAVIDYWLKSAPAGPVRLDILDSRGTLVRRYASDQPPDDPRALAPSEPPYFMDEWLPHVQAPSAHAGHNRFVWDLRYPRPGAPSYDYSIAAIAGQGTVLEPEGPLVVPGDYRVRLTVGEVSQTQPLRVVMDPRVHVTSHTFAAQFSLAERIWNAMANADALNQQLSAVRHGMGSDTGSALAHAIDSLDVDAISAGLGGLETAVEGADREPTASMQAGATDLESQLAVVKARWDGFVQRDVEALNAKRQASGTPAIQVPRVMARRMRGGEEQR